MERLPLTRPRPPRLRPTSLPPPRDAADSPADPADDSDMADELVAIKDEADRRFAAWAAEGRGIGIGNHGHSGNSSTTTLALDGDGISVKHPELEHGALGHGHDGMSADARVAAVLVRVEVYLHGVLADGSTQDGGGKVLLFQSMALGVNDLLLAAGTGGGRGR